MIYLFFLRSRTIGRQDLCTAGVVREFPADFSDEADALIASGAARTATTDERDRFLADAALVDSNQGGRIIQSGLLLSSVSVNLNEGTGAKQPLYTVPPSRRLIITHQDLSELSAAPTIVEFTEGWNTAANDCLSAFHVSDLISDASKSGSILIQPTSWPIGTAAQILGLAVTTPEGTALTGRVNTFGYLTDVNGVPIAI